MRFVLIAIALIGCGSTGTPSGPTFGGLDGRYDGTITIEYRGNRRSLGITMTFDLNGTVTSHSELDQPQHSYYRLRWDRTAIDLYNMGKSWFGHIQLVELNHDRITGYMFPDNGTRDLGDQVRLDAHRVPVETAPRP